jgi:hypothetical protein
MGGFMINLPKLDDQLYKDIVNAARKKIPKLLPEWTDFNVHDPGITLIELLAWLKEMQQYHLDRITDKNKQKFLKLLGIKLKHTTPSKAKIILENNSREYFLPERFRFSSGDIIYETTDRVLLDTCPVKKVVVYDGQVYTDVSNTNDEHEISFYAFGEQQKAGSILYIGFEKPVDPKKKIRFWIDLFDQYPVKRNPVEDGSSIRLNRIEWETFSDGDWIKADSVIDATSGFLHDGFIELEFNCKNDKAKIEACDVDMYWIRAVLEQPGCEESPKIFKIYNNFVFAEQAHTLSEMHEFKFNGGQNCFRLQTYLSLYGKMDIQIGQEDGTWRYIDPENSMVSVNKDYKNAQCIVSVNNDGTFNKLRIICYEPAFETSRIIGSSNQLPHQRFSIRDFNGILKEDILIQVSETDSKGEVIWKDWEYTDELDVAHSKSRCFTIDNSSNEIVFGDNENGLIPPAGFENVLIISCRTSQGTNGNINKGEIDSMPDLEKIAGEDAGNIICYNISDCTRGSDDETVDMALSRLKQKLRTPQRAVTLSDYEFLAKTTPGLRVAKVKAVPSDDIEKSNVRIVVMPYSIKKRPKPNKQYIQAVKRHMEQFRLIGSTIEIIEPQYIEISIYAEIVPSFSIENPEKEIVKTIDSYLSPDGSLFDACNRNIGDPVFESDIISLINSLDCVSYVKRVSLSARGSGWKKSKGGDIYVPFNAMVYPGRHEINFKDS